MEKLFEELKFLLVEELNLHGELVKKAQEMNAGIKEKKVARVQLLTALYDTIIGQVEILEVRRLEVCDALSRALMLKSRHTNLHGLIHHLPKEDQGYFIHLRDSLKGKLQELVKINTSNQILLNESLLAIGKNFELFVQQQSKFANYKQSGTMSKETVNKSIVNHIA